MSNAKRRLPPALLLVVALLAIALCAQWRISRMDGSGGDGGDAASVALVTDDADSSQGDGDAAVGVDDGGDAAAQADSSDAASSDGSAQAGGTGGDAQAENSDAASQADASDAAAPGAASQEGAECPVLIPDAAVRSSQSNALGRSWLYETSASARDVAEALLAQLEQGGWLLVESGYMGIGSGSWGCVARSQDASCVLMAYAIREGGALGGDEQASQVRVVLLDAEG